MRYSALLLIFCVGLVGFGSFYLGDWVGRKNERSRINEAHLLKELVLRGRIDSCQIEKEGFKQAYITAITPLSMENLRAGLGIE